MATGFRYHIFETDLGWVGLLASDSGIRRSVLPCDSPNDCAAELGADGESAVADSRPVDKAVRQQYGFD